MSLNKREEVIIMSWRVRWRVFLASGVLGTLILAIGIGIDSPKVGLAGVAVWSISILSFVYGLLKEFE